MMALNIMIYMTLVSQKKNQLEYDYFKNKENKEIKTDVFKKFTPEELKYWREEIPKTFESETKDFIIK